MILENLKDFMNKLMEDHPDKDSHWDSWARRFIMGIDKTSAAAQRAISMNSLRFTQASGFSDVNAFESETITGDTAKFMPYAVRNHVSKAAVKWCESTNLTGKMKDEAESELAMHMVTAENLLDFC